MVTLQTAYPLQGYTGQPEFDMHERESYNCNSSNDIPELTYTSHTGINEILPQHENNTLNYQKFHPELERWAIFRSLPGLMQYERGFHEALNDIQTGLLKCPNYMDLINPPTLLSYFLTLPKYLREMRLMTSVFYALEYHQRRTPIRQKELALNYMASFFKPVEGKLLTVLTDVCSAKKIRLNMEGAKKMVTNISMY